MNYARRTDANHLAIINRFRALGFSVLDLSGVGKGCPDLLVARNGKTALIEIKDGSKSPSQRKLSPSQREFDRCWKGKLEFVSSEDQVLWINNTWLNS